MTPGSSSSTSSPSLTCADHDTSVLRLREAPEGRASFTCRLGSVAVGAAPSARLGASGFDLGTVAGATGRKRLYAVVVGVTGP